MDVLELLAQRCEMIVVESNFVACRDKNDDMFLNLALDGKADVILSRDPDLLELHPFPSKTFPFSPPQTLSVS